MPDLKTLIELLKDYSPFISSPEFDLTVLTYADALVHEQRIKHPRN